MSAFLRKYGVAITAGTKQSVKVPLVKRAVVDLAIGADFTPSAGDIKVSKDGGAAANIATLPTAVAMGNTAYWEFVFSNTEMSCGSLVVTVADSATKAVEDQTFVIETFGNASAQYAVDPTDAIRYGLTALPNAAADAAGGLPISDAGGLDLDAKLANTNEVTAARMGALTDWINGGRLDLLLDSILEDTGTTLDARIPAALVGGRMDASVGAMAANTLTASALATDAVAEIQNGLATTTELAKVPKSDGTTSWNATALAAINTQVDTALTDYDGPTNAEMVDRTLASAEYATAAVIGTPTGASIAADIVAAQGAVDALAAVAATTTDINTVRSDITGVITAIDLVDGKVDDIPTVSEFNARTVLSATYATADALTTVGTNVSTLVTKLTTGITSLANWLRAIARKGNIDSTTTTEINATTGSGTGTYSAATDSLEAIKDSAAGGGGASAEDIANMILDGVQMEELEPGELPKNPTLRQVEMAKYMPFRNGRKANEQEPQSYRFYNDAGDEISSADITYSSVTGEMLFGQLSHYLPITINNDNPLAVEEEDGFEGTLFAASFTDPNGAFTLSLTGTDAALVDLSGSNIVTDGPLEEGDYTFNVVATDTTYPHVTATLVVNLTVTVSNTAPTITVPSDNPHAVAVVEGYAGTIVDGTATDPDVGDTQTWSISGTDAALFAVNSSTGVVTPVAPLEIGEFTFNLIATDESAATDSAVIDVTVSPSAPVTSPHTSESAGSIGIDWTYSGGANNIRLQVSLAGMNDWGDDAVELAATGNTTIGSLTPGATYDVRGRTEDTASGLVSTWHTVPNIDAGEE